MANDTPVIEAPRRPSDPGIESYVDVIQVARPRSWIALFLCGLLAAGIVFWSLVVRVPIQVELPGVAIRGGSLIEVQAPVSGRVAQMPVLSGANLQAGDVLMTIADEASGKVVEVRSPVKGFLAAMPPSPGLQIQAGQIVAEVEPATGAPQVRVFPEPQVAQQLTHGAKAVVTVMTEGAVPITLTGSVQHIQPAPITAEEVRQVIGDDALGAIVAQGAVVQGVDIYFSEEELAKIKIPEGDDQFFDLAYVAQVTLVLGERHPINYIF